MGLATLGCGLRFASHRRISRRFLLVSALGAILFAASCNQKPKHDDPVSLVSWGSTLQKDLMNDMVTPASGRAGLTVRDDTWDGDYANLTTRIDRGINTWDLVHVDGIFVLTPRWKQLFYQDPNRGPGELIKELLTNNTLSEPLKGGFAVPVLEYGYLIAGRQAKYPGHPITQMTWKDFWDTTTYPGDRGLRDTPVGNIEAALSSMGTNPMTLYQEKDQSKLRMLVEQAIERLRELSKHTTIVWWKNGEALQQGLESGDTPLTAAWSGRVRSSYANVCKTEPDVAKCDIQISEPSSLISTDWWIIPANAKNKEAASRILKEMISQNAVAGASRFSASQGYAVPLNGVVVSDPVAQYFIHAGSSSNNKVLGRIDEAFWGANLDWIDKEWAKFRASQ
jgi:putative spermidine/putrescine transport system substrate-binding protein